MENIMCIGCLFYDCYYGECMFDAPCPEDNKYDYEACILRPAIISDEPEE